MRLVPWLRGVTLDLKITTEARFACALRSPSTDQFTHGQCQVLISVQSFCTFSFWLLSASAAKATSAAQLNILQTHSFGQVFCRLDV